ncbi:MAG: hypothetical protein HYV95_09020 [Opitutae bacterium]|nr:hypothetical protein [Opitutae bacterium]
MNPAPPPLPSEQALARVLKISRLNGWSITILSGLGTLVSLAFGDLVGAGLGLLATGAGAMEVRGHRRLKRGDAGGTRWLVRAELFLLAIIATYAAGRLLSFDAESVRESITPDQQAVLKEAGLEMADIIPLVRTTFRVFYGALLLLTVLYQGGMTLYYRRKVPLIEEALAARPPASG